MNNNLNDEQLKNVAGGSGQEYTMNVKVTLDLGNEFTYDVTIKPYLDGELLSHLVKTVDASTETIVLPIRGRKGKHMLRVKLNDLIIKTYELDFDTNEYVEII